MRNYPEEALNDVRNPSFVSFLDLARWMAASIVFLGHLRNPLFLGYGSVAESDRSLVIQVWYFVTGWHAEAVLVFFVLSGFLVGGLASARARLGRFVPTEYAVDRVTRVYIAFLPALVLTAALDAMGYAWFGEIGFWTHTHPMIREKTETAAFSTLFTLPIFLANAGMMQTIVTAPFGSNQPLWTISLEFWFYVSFGLFLAACTSRSLIMRVVGLAAVLILLGLLGTNFCFYLALWLIGVAVALVPWRALERPVIALGVFLVLLVMVRVNTSVVNDSETLRMIKNFGVSLTFGWLLLSMRRTDWKWLIWAARYNRFMADFSYSLYLLHFPLMLFVLGALHATGWFEGIARGYSPAEGWGVLTYIIVIGATYSFAFLFSLATERQTGKVRALMKHALTRSSIPAAERP